MQVVTDPQKADVVFTDRIGAAFEEHLNELYGQQGETGRERSLSSAPQADRMRFRTAAALIFLVDRKRAT